MAIYSIYYSPTGGTEKTADIIAGAFSEKYEKTDILKKDITAYTFDKDDVCIIAVPVFSGRVPADATRKLRMIQANGAKAVCVAVFGNRAVDDALVELYDTSSDVGFNVVACVEAVAEHSLVRKFGQGRPDTEDKKELEAFAEKISDKIRSQSENTFDIEGCRPYKELKSSPMSVVVDSSCVDCKKCADECPVGAISFEDVKKTDAQKCFSCMHCVTVCAQGARKNSPAVTSALEERLKNCCSEYKHNKLYL